MKLVLRFAIACGDRENWAVTAFPGMDGWGLRGRGRKGLVKLGFLTAEFSMWRALYHLI